MEMNGGKSKSHHLLIAAGVTAAVVITLHFFHELTIVLLLIYAGILFGIFLDGVARAICRWLHINRPVALLIFVIESEGFEMTTIPMQLIIPHGRSLS
jgi:hypothetical protein